MPKAPRTRWSAVHHDQAMGFIGLGPLPLLELGRQHRRGDRVRAAFVAAGAELLAEVEDHQGDQGAVGEAGLADGGTEILAQASGVPHHLAAGTESRLEPLAGFLADRAVERLVGAVAGEILAQLVEGDALVVAEVFVDEGRFAAAGKPAGDHQLGRRGRLLKGQEAGLFGRMDLAGFGGAYGFAEDPVLEGRGAIGEAGGEVPAPGVEPAGRRIFLGAQREHFDVFDLPVAVRAEPPAHVGPREEGDQQGSTRREIRRYSPPRGS